MAKRILFSGQKKQLVPFVILVVVLTMFFSVGIFLGTSRSEIKEAQDKMSVEISYQFLNEWYNEPVVILKNLDNRNWEDCRVDINSRYTLGIDGISFNGSHNGQQVLPITGFIDPEGERFDYSSMVPYSACILCNKPQNSLYCGKF